MYFSFRKPPRPWLIASVDAARSEWMDDRWRCWNRKRWNSKYGTRFFSFLSAVWVSLNCFFLALGTHSTPRQGAILRRWHPCEGKRRRKRRTDLRYDLQYCGPFLSIVFYFCLSALQLSGKPFPRVSSRIIRNVCGDLLVDCLATWLKFKLRLSDWLIDWLIVGFFIFAWIHSLKYSLKDEMYNSFC